MIFCVFRVKIDNIYGYLGEAIKRMWDSECEAAKANKRVIYLGEDLDWVYYLNGAIIYALYAFSDELDP